jgi:hypothetical protein
VAKPVLTPPTATKHLVAALRASRPWQREAIAEAVGTPIINEVASWQAGDFDQLEPAQRRAVEEILSTSSTRPWWSRSHD